MEPSVNGMEYNNSSKTKTAVNDFVSKADNDSNQNDNKPAWNNSVTKIRTYSRRNSIVRCDVADKVKHFSFDEQKKNDINDVADNNKVEKGGTYSFNNNSGNVYNFPSKDITALFGKKKYYSLLGAKLNNEKLDDSPTVKRTKYDISNGEQLKTNSSSTANGKAEQSENLIRGSDENVFLVDQTVVECKESQLKEEDTSYKIESKISFKPSLESVVQISTVNENHNEEILMLENDVQIDPVVNDSNDNIKIDFAQSSSFEIKCFSGISDSITNNLSHSKTSNISLNNDSKTDLNIDRKDEHHLKINESSKNTDKMGILEQVSDFFTSNLQATTNQKPTNVISEMQNNLCEMEKVIVMSSTEQLSSESKLEKLDNVIVGKAEVTNKHCQDNLNITDKNLLHEQAVSRSLGINSYTLTETVNYEEINKMKNECLKSSSSITSARDRCINEDAVKSDYGINNVIVNNGSDLINNAKGINDIVFDSAGHDENDFNGICIDSFKNNANNVINDISNKTDYNKNDFDNVNNRNLKNICNNEINNMFCKKIDYDKINSENISTNHLESKDSSDTVGHKAVTNKHNFDINCEHIKNNIISDIVCDKNYNNLDYGSPSYFKDNTNEINDTIIDECSGNKNNTDNELNIVCDVTDGNIDFDDVSVHYLKNNVSNKVNGNFCDRNDGIQSNENSRSNINNKINNVCAENYENKDSFDVRNETFKRNFDDKINDIVCDKTDDNYISVENMKSNVDEIHDVICDQPDGNQNDFDNVSTDNSKNNANSDINIIVDETCVNENDFDDTSIDNLKISTNNNVNGIIRDRTDSSSTSSFDDISSVNLKNNADDEINDVYNKNCNSETHVDDMSSECLENNTNSETNDPCDNNGKNVFEDVGNKNLNNSAANEISDIVCDDNKIRLDVGNVFEDVGNKNLNNSAANEISDIVCDDNKIRLDVGNVFEDVGNKNLNNSAANEISDIVCDDNKIRLDVGAEHFKNNANIEMNDIVYNKTDDDISNFDKVMKNNISKKCNPVNICDDEQFNLKYVSAYNGRSNPDVSNELLSTTNNCTPSELLKSTDESQDLVVENIGDVAGNRNESGINNRNENSGDYNSDNCSVNKNVDQFMNKSKGDSVCEQDVSIIFDACRNGLPIKNGSTFNDYSVPRNNDIELMTGNCLSNKSEAVHYDYASVKFKGWTCVEQTISLKMRYYLSLKEQLKKQSPGRTSKLKLILEPTENCSRGMFAKSNIESTDGLNIVSKSRRGRPPKAVAKNVTTIYEQETQQNCSSITNANSSEHRAEPQEIDRSIRLGISAVSSCGNSTCNRVNNVYSLCKDYDHDLKRMQQQDSLLPYKKRKFGRMTKTGCWTIPIVGNVMDDFIEKRNSFEISEIKTEQQRLDITHTSSDTGLSLQQQDKSSLSSEVKQRGSKLKSTAVTVSMTDNNTNVSSEEQKITCDTTEVELNVKNLDTEHSSREQQFRLSSSYTGKKRGRKPSCLSRLYGRRKRESNLTPLVLKRGKKRGRKPKSLFDATVSKADNTNVSLDEENLVGVCDDGTEAELSVKNKMPDVEQQRQPRLSLKPGKKRGPKPKSFDSIITPTTIENIDHRNGTETSRTGQFSSLPYKGRVRGRKLKSALLDDTFIYDSLSDQEIYSDGSNYCPKITSSTTSKRKKRERPTSVSEVDRTSFQSSDKVGVHDKSSDFQITPTTKSVSKRGRRPLKSASQRVCHVDVNIICEEETDSSNSPQKCTTEQTDNNECSSNMEDSAADITIVYEDIIDCDNDVKIISDEPNTNVRRCKKKRQYIKRQELWPRNYSVGENIMTEDEKRKKFTILRFMKNPLHMGWDLEDFLSTRMVQCGRCDQEMKLMYYRRFHCLTHYYLCWLKDEEPPIDLEDRATMESYLKKALVSSAQKYRTVNFSCSECDHGSKSIYGYVSHIFTCNKIEQCSVCRTNVPLVNMNKHLMYHEKKRLNRERLVKNAFDLQLEILKKKISGHKLDVPPAVRRLAFLDDTNNKIIKQSEKRVRKKPARFDYETEQKENKRYRKEEVSDVNVVLDELKDYWFKVEMQSELTCPRRGCKFECLNSKTITDHFQNCSFKFYWYFCRRCTFRAQYFGQMVSHHKNCVVVKSDYSVCKIEDKNNYEDDNDDDDDDDDDDDIIDDEKKDETFEAGNISSSCEEKNESSGSNDEHDDEPIVENLKEETKVIDTRVRTFASYMHTHFNNIDENLLNTIKRNKILRKQMFSSPLCLQITTNDGNQHFLTPAEAEDYLPVTKQSIYVSVTKDSLFRRFNRFQSEIVNDMPIIFVGGPVFSLSWLPKSDECTERDEYLAIYCHPHMDHKFSNKKCYNFRSLIQLWKIPELHSTKRVSDIPQFYFGIAHEFGVVWQLEWSPSYHSNTRSSNESDLGILAAATSSGFVPIYSVPKITSSLSPDETNCKIIKLEPGFILKCLDEPEAQCTRISWEKTSPHTTLFGGFSDGTVAMWRVDTNSAILKEGKIIYAFRTFQAHSSEITALSVHSLDGCRYLLTGSGDRLVHCWDLDLEENLTNFTTPNATYNKGSYVVDSIWLPYSLSTLTINDYAYRVVESPCTMYSLNPKLADPQVKSLFHSLESLRTISLSGWTNSLAVGSLTGTVHSLIYKHLIMLVTTRPHNAKPSLLAEVSLIPRDKLDIKLDLNKDEVHTDDDITSYNYALNKYAMQLARTLKKTNTKKTAMDKFCLHAEYPLRCVNKVCWNPNFSSFNWLSVGYHNGFVRLIRTNERCD